VHQLGELVERFGEFEERGARVLALDQEDESVDGLWDLLERLGEIPFELATDVGRAGAPRLDRITTYLLDRSGRVIEIFPSHPLVWMPWDAVLQRIDLERRSR
jgi:hypothetical protein